MNKALGTHSRIHHSGVSLAELAHLIERTEREIYEKAVGPIRPNEYRHNLGGERSRVVSEIQAAWSHIASLVTTEETDKPLLLAAIDAVAGIRPQSDDEYDHEDDEW